jgi:hypothetical protein
MLNDITIVRSLYFLITEFAENPQLVRDGNRSAKGAGHAHVPVGQDPGGL